MSNKAESAAGKTYSIGSLRDIFELPSYDAMERCLTELKTMMLHARAMNRNPLELRRRTCVR